jgi:DHA1 family tetracycline resistance protein-like MFS transporter
MALWGVAGAAGQAILSRQVGPSEQGRLQGALSAVQAIAGIASPFIFNGVFSAFVGPWRSFGVPGAPFLVAGLILLLGLVQAARVTRDMPSPNATQSAAAS